MVTVRIVPPLGLDGSSAGGLLLDMVMTSWSRAGFLDSAWGVCSTNRGLDGGLVVVLGS